MAAGRATYTALYPVAAKKTNQIEIEYNAAAYMLGIRYSLSHHFTGAPNLTSRKLHTFRHVCVCECVSEKYLKRKLYGVE